MFTIEIVASTLHSCIEAQTGGARRIELCSALGTAGITPSAGLVQLARQYVTIPVFVMIRPREGHFHYSGHEIETMKRDIENMKLMGTEGVVFGVLNAHGEVDHKLARDLVQVALPMRCTFHRAIDLVPDLLESVDAVVESGCERILTSGGKATGAEGIEMIRAMHHRAAGRVVVMPGGGITAGTIDRVLTPGITDYHLSARVTASPPAEGSLFDLSFSETDATVVRNVVTITKAFFRNLAAQEAGS